MMKVEQEYGSVLGDGHRPMRDSLIKRIIAPPRGRIASALQITSADLAVLWREEGYAAVFSGLDHLTGQPSLWRGLEICLIEDAGPSVQYA